MGLIALFAIAVHVMVVSTAFAAAVVSSAELRRIPLFWIVAALSAVLVPFIISEPLPTRTDHGALSYFLSGDVFSHFNLICFGGSVISWIVSLLPIGTLRIASAASWGFVSALAVRSFLLLNS